MTEDPELTVLLPRSTFFHVGRTGGHWVAHALWKAGLSQETLRPLHLTPAQFRYRFPEKARPFSFCFVRHPLDWLASVWLHEMEFGWEATEITHRAGADVFAVFLERMLAAWPEGPCWAQVSPFVEECDFVGRTETLAEDLAAALAAAGEVHDPASLAVPRLNESTSLRLRRAARAPRDLHEAIMQVERTNFARFGYHGVPERLVAESPPDHALPRLRVKADADVGAVAEAGRLGLLTPAYEYRLEHSACIDGDKRFRRLQWGLLSALDAAPREGRCLILHQSDPHFAYVALNAGFTDVTFACADPDLVSPRLQSTLEGAFNVIDFTSLADAPEGQYDLVVMSGGLDISLLPEFELLRAGRLLKPGGRLIFAAPTLQIDDPALAIKTLWPLVDEFQGRKLAYATLGYINRTLSLFGLSEATVEDRFGEAPHPDLRPEVEALAGRFGVDPDLLLSYVVVSATLNDCPRTAERRRRLTALWLSRLPVCARETSLDWMPPVAQTTISTLLDELKAERARRERAEQGLIDRERDLATARADLAAHVADADFHREQLRRERLVAEEAVANYRALLKRLEIAAQT